MKCRYFFLTLLLLSFFSYSSYCEDIEFKVSGFETVGELPKLIHTDWDENVFGQKKATEYSHKIARMASIFAEVAYSDVLYKKMDSELVSCYRDVGVKDNDLELHYDVDYQNPFWGNDQCAYSIASKKLNSSKGSSTLVFIVIRGTPLNANEWISNLNLSNRTRSANPIHEGFSRAAQQVHSSLMYYLIKHKIDIDDTYFFITGHSRGAAISNVLAANMLEEGIISTEKIYCYTFACPNVTTYKTATEKLYNYIWNITSAEDIVPTVPMNRNNWEYTKYGTTLIIVNSWNMDRTKFNNEYIPKMNVLFNKLLQRDYCPFESGPFIPVQITAAATGFNKTTDVFYSSLTGIHDIGETMFHKIFPQNEDNNAEHPQERGNSRILQFFYNWINKKTNGNADYIMNAFIDMHAMETYMSWVLSFDEDQLYSDLGYSQIVITGKCNFRVMAEDDKVIVSGQDGLLNIWEDRRPLAAMQFGLDKCVIGFPSNENFTVIVTDDCLIPTPVKFKIEKYKADGRLEKEYEPQIKHLDKFSLYSFIAGKNTYDNSSIEMSKLNHEKKVKIKKETGILKNDGKRTLIEISSDTDLNLEGGIQHGSKKLYSKGLFSYSIFNFAKSIELSGGIGHQETLYGPINLDLEILPKALFALGKIDNDDWRFNIVPSARTAISLKPFQRVTLFTAAVFDFHIRNFNDAAFDNDIRKTSIKTFSLTDNINVAPTIRIGIKL